MRLPSDYLHRIIKSLSKSEKGYFLKSLSNNSQSRKLFHAMDNQKVYDEGKLRNDLKDERFQRQIHVAKNSLFRQIMKTLYQYDSQNSLNHKFSIDLSTISNLYYRGLYRESLKQISQSKRLAYSEEKFEFVPELLRWEKYVITALSEPDITEKLNKLTEEESYLAAVFSNLIEFRKLHTEISSLMRVGGSVRGKSEEKLFKKIIHGRLLKSVDNAMCFEAKVLYFQIYLIYYQAQSDDKNTYQLSNKLIDYMDSMPQSRREFAREYILGFIASLSSSFNMGNYDESKSIIKRLRNFQTRSNEQQEYIFFSTYIIELRICIVMCEFDNIERVIENISSRLKRFIRKENNVTQLLLFQDIFYVYFTLEKYDKALEWLNKILSVKSEIRQDIHSIAHILNLIVHYELNNLDLLSYSVLNTYRYLTRRKRLYKFEEIVLKFIRRISKTFDIKEEFELLKHEVLKLTDDPYERIPLEYFDFISWLESKLTGKSLIEVRKSKLL